MATFQSLGLTEKLIEALDYMGFKDATPIQEKAIPEIIKGRDLLACAQTGTGKTAAFILPVLHALSLKNSTGTKALIVAPTRELAIQIDKQIQGLAYFVDMTSIAVYGGGDGDDWDNQRNAFKNGVDIIVATPGKLLSHMNMGYAQMKNLEFFILDEADRMLDIGFHQDIINIRKKLPEKLQTLMFSATMPGKIKTLANEILDKNPFLIELSVSKPAEGVLQASYLVNDRDKVKLIVHLLQEKEDQYQSVIVFCSTKKKVSETIQALKRAKLSAAGISSDLEQSEREEQLRLFKAKKIQILVATDVISRGIDIQDISLVINLNVPNDAEDYVHRIGRTARAASTGVALTFIDHAEMDKFAAIERFIEKEIPKIPCPTEVGVAPEWNTRPPRNNKGNKGNKGKKKFFKKK